MLEQPPSTDDNPKLLRIPKTGETQSAKVYCLNISPADLYLFVPYS